MHNYAVVESGIKMALTAVLEIDLGNGMIVFEPYSAVNLKNVAKSLAKERLKPQWVESFCSIVGEWSGFSSIRNAIAHNRWTDGTQPGAIKPHTLNIREGKVRWIGNLEDEVEFTATDLEAKAHALNLINERLKLFLHVSGLAAIIETKIEAAKASRSSDSGKDGKQSSK